MRSPARTSFAPVLVVVTDPRYPIDRVVRCIEDVARALPEGSVLVQHRDKTSTLDERDRAAERIARTGVPFVVNGEPSDALRLGARGVHLPGGDPDIARARAVLGDDAWISIAAHDDEAVGRATALGATAALVSPIFATAGKGPPRGLDAIRRARALADDSLAIYALGGIDVRHAASCAAAGAHGIAAIRSIFDASDAAAAARALATPFLA